jgi:hypothetical protein
MTAHGQAKEPHYTKVPEWVTESGVVGMELAVYHHLAKRLHHTSASRTVDPSRVRLATDVGLKKADDVDPYLRGLAALGVIVIHGKKGVRTTYELPLFPPEGWDGPSNTHVADKWQSSDPKGYSEWKARQRAKVAAAEAPFAAKRKARVAKSKAKKALADPDRPVATGRSADFDVPVGTDTHQPVGTGRHLPVGTGTNQTTHDDQTNVGDGRRPSTSGDGPREGGRAASGKTAPAGKEFRGDYESQQGGLRDPQPSPMNLPDESAGDGRRPPTGSRCETRPPTAALRTVIQRIPGVLAAQLQSEFPRGLPASVNEAVGLALTGEQRTVEQVVARLERRWMDWAYENDAVAESGSGLARPLGVLLTLLGPSACWGNNARCEDGTDIDTGVACPRCEEARADKAAARRGESVPPTDGYSVPFQRPADSEPSPYVQCTGAGCGVKMMPTEDGLCRECRTEGAFT